MPASSSGEGAAGLQKWHAIEAKPFEVPKSKGSLPSWFPQPGARPALWTDCVWFTRRPPGATKPLFFNACLTSLTALDPNYQPDMGTFDRSCLPWGWVENPGRKRDERFSDLVRRCTTANDPRLQFETAYVNKPLCSRCKVMIGDNVSSIEHLANLTVDSPTFERVTHGSTLESFADAVRNGCFICCTAFRQFECLRLASGGEDGCKHPHILNSYTIGPAADFMLSFKCVPELSCHPQELQTEIPLSLELMTPMRFKMLDPEYTPRATDTSSAEVLSLAAEWLSNCSRLHDCDKQRFCSPDSLPTRLIGIGDETSTYWRLVVTKDAPITRAEYIALSYCWGDTLQLQLTTKTQSTFMKGVSIAVLPKTHRDLVTVARSFGVRWLWIDALCILQDSKSDWTHESMAMAETFANAKLVVAAAASVNSQGGLFRERQVDGLSPLILRQPNRAYMLHNANYWEQHVENSPLFRRGWALQERLLPDRVLYFSDQQVLFECRRQRLCEGFPCNAAILRKPQRNLMFFKQPTFTDSKIDLGSQLSQNLKIWADIVIMYQKCDFTFKSDKLVALAGVMKMVEKQTGDECLAGLWKSRLLFYLGWSSRDKQRFRIPEVDTPSWSWMSMKGIVKWETEMHMMLNKNMDQADVSLNGTVPLARIIEASAEALSRNKNEVMMRGRLHLKGSLVKARLLRYRPKITDGGATVIVTKYGKYLLGKRSESIYLLEMDMDLCLAEAFPDQNFDMSTSARGLASQPEFVQFHNMGIESLRVFDMEYHDKPSPATFEVVPEAASVFALMLHADATNGNILSALGLVIVSEPQRPGVFRRIGLFRLAADIGTGKEFMSISPASDGGIYKLRGTPELRDIELV